MMLSRSGESGNWKPTDDMNETPSVRVLRQLLSRYSTIREIAATYHVLPSTFCLWCAIRGLQHMKLRRCEIDARHIRMICKLRKEGVSCQKISDRLDISRHIVRLVMQEAN